MQSDDEIRETTAATLRFERDLESLVLTAFADGARIEGTWTVEVPVATAPDWTVELQKDPGEAESGEVGPSKVEPDEVRPDEVRPDEVGPDEVGPDEVDAGRGDSAEADHRETNGGYSPEFVEE